MGFISRLFGSDVAIAKTVDAGISALDSIFYTNEEKAADHMEARKQLAQQTIDLMRATSGQNLSRRLIALLIVGMWVLSIATGTALLALAPFIPAQAEVMQASAMAVTDTAVSLWPTIALVLGFYFAPSHISKFVDAFRGNNKS